MRKAETWLKTHSSVFTMKEEGKNGFHKSCGYKHQSEGMC